MGEVIFDNDNAAAILNKAIDTGINFIDTADVYSDGESEKVVGRILKKPQRKNLCSHQMRQANSAHM